MQDVIGYEDDFLCGCQMSNKIIYDVLLFPVE